MLMVVDSGIMAWEIFLEHFGCQLTTDEQQLHDVIMSVLKNSQEWSQTVVESKLKAKWRPSLYQPDVQT